MKSNPGTLFLIPLVLCSCQYSKSATFEPKSTEPKAGAIHSFGTGDSYLPWTPIVLNTLWRVNVSGSADYRPLTTPFGSERDAYPSDGQTWYLTGSSSGSQTALYRAYIPGTPWFLDSTSPAGEGPYQVIGPIGLAWNQPAPGREPLWRWYKGNGAFPGGYSIPTGGNPASSNSADAALMNLQIPAYSPLGLYGYRRYGKCLDRNRPECLNNLMTISDSANTVISNKVAGGVVWEWYWNGKNFVNNGEGVYGRQMQSALWYCARNPSGGVTIYNPTEAGAETSAAYYNRNPHYPFTPELFQGAPLVDATVSAASITTHAVPLEYATSPSPYAGGDADHPVLMSDVQLGKQLTLGVLPAHKRGTATIARYDALVNSASALPNQQNIGGCEGVPTQFQFGIHTTPEFNVFRSLTFNSSGSETHSPDPISLACSPTGVDVYAPEWGGTEAAMVETATGSHAMAFFTRLADPLGGSGYVKLNLGNMSCTGSANQNPGAGEFDDDTNRLFATYVSGPTGIPAGERSVRVYIVTGTSADVIATLRVLAQPGNAAW